MTRAIAHRGPDGQGWVGTAGGGFAFGHRRLAILDLSEAGRQPMSGPAGRYWITYNGEVYNYRELRSLLEKKGYPFRSATDTEVVLAAWEEWGPRCLDRLNGIFAFAVWDSQTRTLWLARDRIGVKPLYWAPLRRGLAFASEIKALLAAEIVAPEADPEVVHNPWHYPSAPRTGFLGVHKLPPGHLLTWRDSSLRLERWWSLRTDTDHAGLPQAEEELADLLRDAVRLQMVADVPIGALLSGGLDSSLLVSQMRQLSADSPLTFSIAFRRTDRRLERQGDDGVHACRVARLFGCRHREIEVSPDIVGLLPKLVWHMDEPVADPAAINTYLIARAARDAGVVVLLSGMGADEIFAGYRRHLACLLVDRYRVALPGSLRRRLASVLAAAPVAGPRSGYRLLRWSKRFLAIADLEQVQRYLQSDLSLPPALYARLYAHADERPYETLKEVAGRRAWLQAPGLSYLARMCLLDTLCFLPDHNLTYTDKASMAAGVEVRPPFTDHRVVELAFRLADRCRIAGTTQKRILRRVARRWLPRSVVHRPKTPFGAPLRAWIRGELREMVDDLLAPGALRARGIYRPEAVWEVIRADREGREDHAHLIWTLLWRELWFRTFIDGEAQAWTRAVRERAGRAPEALPGGALAG